MGGETITETLDREPPEMVTLPQRGGAMAVRRWPIEGEAEKAALLHANGLTALCYRRLIEGLSPLGGILAFDHRGHGHTQLAADPAALRSWHVYAEDAEALLLSQPTPDGGWTLIGHSMGAVFSLMVAARGKVPVRRIMMIDPVVLPRFMPLIASTPLHGLLKDMIPVARKSAKRRAHFPSRQAAREAWADRSFFSRWADGVLDDYLADGLVDDGDGDGVRLACDPAWEAATFTAQAHFFWSAFEGALRATGGDIHAVYAGTGSTTSPARRQRLERRGVSGSTVPGTTHLLPLEQPDAVAGRILDALGGI